MPLPGEHRDPAAMPDHPWVAAAAPQVSLALASALPALRKKEYALRLGARSSSFVHSIGDTNPPAEKTSAHKPRPPPSEAVHTTMQGKFDALRGKFDDMPSDKKTHSYEHVLGTNR